MSVALLLGLFLVVADAHAARLEVCAFSFHGPAEIQVFKERLPAEVRPDLRCDVVVYSAEFAGSFFGANGKALSLADMEEASCQARCDALLHHPREVFLLGCNTLATKAQDTRTPAQYLQVLLDHGFDRATAERVVGTRYGPLGPSFRESLRRIFMDVPRLYGFSSVAPAGEHTAPLLERYFRAKGDYRRYLEQGDRDSGRKRSCWPPPSTGPAWSRTPV